MNRFTSIVLIVVFSILLTSCNHKEVESIYLLPDKEVYHYQIGEDDIFLVIKYKGEEPTLDAGEYYSGENDYYNGIDYVHEDDVTKFQTSGVYNIRFSIDDVEITEKFIVYENQLDFQLLQIYDIAYNEGGYNGGYQDFLDEIRQENLDIQNAFIHNDNRGVIVYSDGSMKDLGNLYECGVSLNP